MVYASEVFKRTRTLISHQSMTPILQSQMSITQEFRQLSRHRYDKDGSRGEKWDILIKEKGNFRKKSLVYQEANQVSIVLDSYK